MLLGHVLSACYFMCNSLLLNVLDFNAAEILFSDIKGRGYREAAWVSFLFYYSLL
jgi:hypothetical protein